MRKKLFLSIACLALSALAYSQSKPTLSDYKPKKGSVLAEGIIGDIANGPNFNTFPNAEYGLKFRYFLKDDMAVRIHFGESKNNTTTYLYDPTDDTQSGTYKNSQSDFSVYLGVEKHFEGTNRLSTYMAFDLGYTSTTTKDDVENGTIPANNTSTYSKNEFYTSSIKNSGIVVKLGTGADYYIAKKLYLGAELGLALKLHTNNSGDTSYTEPVNGDVTTTSSHKDSKTTDITTGFAPSAGFRIGYIF